MRFHLFLFCLLLILTIFYMILTPQSGISTGLLELSSFKILHSKTPTTATTTPSTLKDPIETIDPPLQSPGVIAKLPVAGLGNQLFIYACSYSLSLKLGLPLHIEIPEGLNDHSNSASSASREYLLNYFTITPESTFTQSPTHSAYNSSSVLYFNNKMLLYHDFTKETDKIFVSSDYCESELFFAPHSEQILEQFRQQLDLHPSSLSLQRWASLIQQDGNSVGIHVRLGDTENIRHRQLTPKYYLSAMRTIAEEMYPKGKPRFFIFSDTPEKALANVGIPENQTGRGNFTLKIFKGLEEISVEYFVVSGSGLRSIEEFNLMTKCGHFVMAVGTFSWWASYLIKNPKKIVIGSRTQEAFAKTVAKGNKFIEIQYEYLYYPRNVRILNEI